MPNCENGFYVYIMTNSSGTLYVGMTNDIRRRVVEHKSGRVEGFTKRYRINRLLFVQTFETANEAITAEKQLKGWKRERKIDLIKQQNPEWKDLSREWE